MFGLMCLLALFLFCTTVALAVAHDPESHGSHKVPTINKPMTSVTLKPDTIPLTFDPLTSPPHTAVI